MKVQHAKELFAFDMEQFENSVKNLHRFNTRFLQCKALCTSLASLKPGMCLMECFDVSEKPFCGYLVNLDCRTHLKKMPVSSFMIFGGVQRKEEAQAAFEEKIMINLTEDQKRYNLAQQ